MSGGTIFTVGCNINGVNKNGIFSRALADGLRTMHARKTGALIRASAVAGAIMGGGSDTQLRQSMSTQRTWGWPSRLSGKPTYPALYGLESSRRMANDCIERAEAVLRSAGLGDARLLEIGRWREGVRRDPVVLGSGFRVRVYLHGSVPRLHPRAHRAR